MGDVHSLRSWDSDELPEFLGGGEQTNKFYIMNTLLIDFLEERGLLEEFKRCVRECLMRIGRAEYAESFTEYLLREPDKASISGAFGWGEVESKTNWSKISEEWRTYYLRSKLSIQTAELKEGAGKTKVVTAELKESDSAIGIATTGGTFDAYDALERCEYCEKDGKELFDNDGVTVFIDDKALSVGIARSCEVCDMDDEYEARVKINYCPMCGRKL